MILFILIIHLEGIQCEICSNVTPFHKKERSGFFFVKYSSIPQH